MGFFSEFSKAFWYLLPIVAAIAFFLWLGSLAKKQCPTCAQWINREAIKCPFCGQAF
jgi:hypothetical protein